MKILTKTLIILLILVGCSNIKKNNRGILFDLIEKDKYHNRLAELELIESQDSIKGLFYSIDNEPSSKSEDYEWFTNNEVCRYFQFEKNEPKIFKIPINKIIDIRKSIDPIDSNRIMIEIKAMDTILYNERENKEEIFTENYEIRPPHDSNIKDQIQFFDKLKNEWKQKKNYKKLSQIYSQFFNPDGTKKITDNIKIEREKLKLLKSELAKYPFRIIDKTDFVILHAGEKIIEVYFDHVDSKYSVYELTMKKELTEESDIMNAIILFPVHKRLTFNLPYTSREMTLVDWKYSEEKNIQDILKKNIK